MPSGIETNTMHVPISFSFMFFYKYVHLVSLLIVWLCIYVNFFQITVLQNNQKVSSLPVNYEPSSVSIISTDDSFVAVGGTADNKVSLLLCYFHQFNVASCSIVLNLTLILTRIFVCSKTDSFLQFKNFCNKNK